MKTALTSTLALLATAGAASAGPMMLVTHNDQLFVTDGVSVLNQYTLSDDITSLAVDPASGAIYGTSSSDNDNDGFFEVYRLRNWQTTPTLQLVGDFLTENTPSLSFMGGQLYGIQTIPGGASGPSTLVTIDLGAGTQANVAGQGNMNERHSGSGYDAATDTFYAFGRGNDTTAALYTNDYAAGAASSFVGLTNYHTVNHGGEFIDGTLYQAVNHFMPGGNQDLTVGRVNTVTGNFTELLTISAGIGGGSVGLSGVPTPGAAAILGIAGIAGLRRRR